MCIVNFFLPGGTGCWDFRPCPGSHCHAGLHLLQSSHYDRSEKHVNMWNKKGEFSICFGGRVGKEQCNSVVIWCVTHSLRASSHSSKVNVGVLFWASTWETSFELCKMMASVTLFCDFNVIEGHRDVRKIKCKLTFLGGSFFPFFF